MILETRHLQLVAAVAEHGTLTRASQDLNLTQSALSHQLMSLETRLGTPLFHRLGKRMTMTPAGVRLLVAAQRTLGELREAEDDLQKTAQGREAILRVSTECYTTYHWIPRVMRAFAERHPGVEVQIVAGATADPLKALHDGELDVAVMMNRYTGKHIRAFPLFDDELVVVTCPGHPLAARPYVDAETLAGEHLLVYSPLADATSFLGSMLREKGITPRRVSRIQLTEAILELVEAGMGVAVLARWAVAPYAARGRVALVRLGREGVHRQWHAVALRQSAATTHVKAFIQLLTPGPLVLEKPLMIRPTLPPKRWRAVGGER
ncbi:MAG: LysR family transcriptional regulator [Gemmatimonadales bacterium]